jgi:PIN domain nuclease of toxin-antitoxin system
VRLLLDIQIMLWWLLDHDQLGHKNWLKNQTASAGMGHLPIR